jgi:hypothetical protein
VVNGEGGGEGGDSAGEHKGEGWRGRAETIVLLRSKVTDYLLKDKYEDAELVCRVSVYSLSSSPILFYPILFLLYF